MSQHQHQHQHQQQQQQPAAQQPVDFGQFASKAGPYPIEAYNFVREGLSFTSQKVHEHEADPAAPEATGGAAPGVADSMDRHISGQQLCLGLRDFAIHQYGLLAPTVLAHWNIRRTDDFGRIVFNMVDVGLMTKTDEDTPEDFRAVYDFREAFSREQLLSALAAG